MRGVPARVRHLGSARVRDFVLGMNDGSVEILGAVTAAVAYGFGKLIQIAYGVSV